MYLQILTRLQTDPDVVLPWQPEVPTPDSVYNREGPIPPQCYTDNGGIHNPCYVCHQDAIAGRENVMNDHDLQEAYSFSDTGLTNHWQNLFEDRSARVAKITDGEILAYVNTDNYSELPARLQSAGFNGWIPDLENLQLGAAAFDDEGFALDGSWWVAFSYKPLPSTFWPTQGSTDDVMIRLPRAFYVTAAGAESREVYKANLALLEANIKGFETIGAWPIDESEVGTDLNGDGSLGVVTEVSATGEHYVGGASAIDRIAHVYPQGTEFLHTVRYLGIDEDGAIFTPSRMKEVRYMKRRIQSRHFQLLHHYQEENLQKEMGSLPTYIDFGHEGLSSHFGWNVTGFIENRQGRLRWNTYEENLFCMGCHTSIGSTIDKTFSFVRKIDGVDGWGYLDLRTMKDAPNLGESLNEIATYFDRVGGGTEFRSNPELEARYFHGDGTVNTIALASSRSVYDLIMPSAERAMQLNKAYKVIVEDQDFIYGRDATVTPPPRVLSDIDNETSQTLEPENQYQWNMLLDWSDVATANCHYTGDVDFAQLQGEAYQVTIAEAQAREPALCTRGSVNLTGPLTVTYNGAHPPEAGSLVELIHAGQLEGQFTAVTLPDIPGMVISLTHLPNGLALAVARDTDNDGIADAQDNCSTVANGPPSMDAEGFVQRDTDGDGYGNVCDADLNNDGITNQLDSQLFRERFGTADPDADFNGDGRVDQIDANVMRVLFGRPPGPAFQTP